MARASERLERCRLEPQVHGAQQLLQLGDRGGAGDRRGDGRLREHPRDRHLRGRGAALRGDFAQVLRSCDAVLPFFRATQARYVVSECQYLRGAALYYTDSYAEALAATDEALAICEELGISAAVEVNRIYRGQELRALGRYQEARGRCR